MLSTPSILILIGIIIFLGFYFRVIFDMKNIPDVISLIILGLLLGPAFHVINPKDFGQMGSVFNNVVLCWILYNSGISLKLTDVMESFRDTMGITTVGFLATSFTIALFCHYVFGLNILESLFVGTTLGGTNTAVITGLVKKVDITKHSKTTLVMESAMTDIFTLAFPISIMNYIINDTGSPTKILTGFASSIVFSLIIGIGGAFLWGIIVNKFKTLKKTKFSSLAFLFILFGVSEMLEFNGPLTALSFGITVGNMRTFLPESLQHYIPNRNIVVTNSERRFYDQIEFMLRIFFFIYVGLSIQISNYDILLWGLVTVIAIFLARVLVVRIVIKKSTPLLDKSVMSVMIAKGLGAAVIATLPIQEGYKNGDIMQSICYAIILFSTFVCVILFAIVAKSRHLYFFRFFFGSDKAVSKPG